MEVGKMSFEEFKKMADEQSVLKEPVSQEEWEQHAKDRKWSFSTALIRIRNARRGVTAAKDRTVMIGYPLGGRDFTYRGVDIEDVKSHFIPLLMEDDKLLELTQFGHFKGKHLHKCEVEVETTTKPGRDPSITFTNHNVRTVTVHDQKVSIKKLAKLAKAVGELSNTDLYEPVIFEGHMTPSFDKEPVWGDSEEEGRREIVDYFSMTYNKQPCFQFQMIDQGVLVRVRLQPTKYSVKVTNLQDLMTILEENNPDDLSLTYTGKRVIVVGCLRGFDEGDEMNFANVDTTLVLEHPEQTVYEPEAATSTAGEGEEGKGAQTAPSKVDVLADLKKKVAEAHAALGDSMTPQSVREIVTIPDRVSGAVLKKLIEKQLSGPASVENSEVDNMPTDLEAFVVSYTKKAQKVSGSCLWQELIDEAVNRGHKRTDAEEMVNKLIERGEIYEKELGKLRVP